MNSLTFPPKSVQNSLVSQTKDPYQVRVLSCLSPYPSWSGKYLQKIIKENLLKYQTLWTRKLQCHQELSDNKVSFCSVNWLYALSALSGWIAVPMQYYTYWYIQCTQGNYVTKRMESNHNMTATLAIALYICKINSNSGKQTPLCSICYKT